MRTPLTAAAARVAGMILLCVGLAGAALPLAPPQTWAIPLQPGPVAPGWRLVELRRTDAVVQLTLDDGTRRTGLRLSRRGDRAGPPALAWAGRYRLDAADPTPPPVEVAEAIAAPIAAWEAAWPRPPAFVRATSSDPTPAQRWTTLSVEVAVALGVSAAVALAPELAAACAPWSWGYALAAGLLGAAASLGLGLTGLWHSNQHGHDRLSDLAHAVPAWDANLARVHGTAYYALLGPLVDGGPDGGHPPALAALTIATLGLVAWLPAFTLALRDAPRAAAAVALLAGSTAWLRLAGTDSMYVPALLATGAVATAVEALLATGQRRWLTLLLPWLLVAMHTRADLLVLAPCAVAARLITAPTRLRDLVRDPAAWLGVSLIAAPTALRVAEMLASDRPEAASRRADAWLDPRRTALLGLVAVGVVAWRSPRRAPQAALLAVLATAAVAVYGIGLDPHPWGFERPWRVHAGLDPALTAPWLVALPAVGMAAMWRRDPPLFAFLATAFGASALLYLGRHDCWSTFLSTSLAAQPLLAAASAAALPRRAAAWGVALALSGLAWSVPWLTTPWPKVAQDRLLRAIPDHVPPGTRLVWLGPDDVPPEAADEPGARQRVDLPRHVGDRYEVWSIRAWREAGAPRPAVFVETLDCHRPLLRRTPPLRAWIGPTSHAWELLQAPVVGDGPRYHLDGADDDFTWPDCAALREHARLGPWSVQAGTQGSIWDEAHGADAQLGLWDLR